MSQWYTWEYLKEKYMRRPCSVVYLSRIPAWRPKQQSLSNAQCLLQLVWFCYKSHSDILRVFSTALNISMCINLLIQRGFHNYDNGQPVKKYQTSRTLKKRCFQPKLYASTYTYNRVPKHTTTRALHRQYWRFKIFYDVTCKRQELPQFSKQYASLKSLLTRYRSPITLAWIWQRSAFI